MLVDVKRDNPLVGYNCSQKVARKSLRDCGIGRLYKYKKGFYSADMNIHLVLENTIKTEFPIFCGYANDQTINLGPFKHHHLVNQDYLHCYGVCDSPDQFIERYEKLLEEDPRRLFVTFFKVEKRRQPKRGGWRWHKWGPYIGDKDPQHEYIRDEDDTIKVVYCYQIREAN